MGNVEKISVLLVEDEHMLAEILADTLGDRGFEVTVAYDGREGSMRCIARVPTSSSPIS